MVSKIINNILYPFILLPFFYLLTAPFAVIIKIIVSIHPPYSKESFFNLFGDDDDDDEK